MSRAVTDVVVQQVRVLLDRGITQIDQLEVLLAMTRSPGRTWTFRSVADDALLSDDRAEDSLAELERIGLVRCTFTGPDEPLYSPSPDLDLAGVQALRSLRGVDRARIANAFFSCTLAALRDFASEFRRGRSG